MAIKLQNWVSLAIQLSKPIRFDHLIVLKGDFADMDDTWQYGPHVNLSPPPKKRPRAPEQRKGERDEREERKRS